MDLVLSPSHEQDEFNEMVSRVLAALPSEASGELLGSIVAAILTEFVNDERTVAQILDFAKNAAGLELDRYHAEAARVN